MISAPWPPLSVGVLSGGWGIGVGDVRKDADLLSAPSQMFPRSASGAVYSSEIRRRA